ncbi:hypothetical protein NDU88_007311 [Pleurodeles waltl]|uniref:Uncharacterized protein n=1 Tax=Pleurodeles waltl TaxID=8319 RepID=A0AAV7UP00_PLEWA|nr:hypothetical protein NDU88_007311 [Pleurodeles waltl]
MAPKSIRTPCSSRAQQNPDPGGAKRDKRHPALGSKEHSNPHGKEPHQRISGTEKDARKSVPTMFASIMKTKQMPPEKDIGISIASMEARTEELETEVRAATAQTATQGQQISDIQWKLEDAENRQLRNNLRVLGIAEGLVGQDTRAYVVSLFKSVGLGKGDPESTTIPVNEKEADIDYY